MKVYRFKCQPFKFPIFQTVLDDGKKENDALKTFKEKFAVYDILVGNFLTSPALTFLSSKTRK